MDRPFTISIAGPHDAGALTAMQARSMRVLAQPFYDADVIEAFIAHGTMDDALLNAETFLVAKRNGELIACGGWSADAPSYHASLAEMENVPHDRHEHRKATVRSLFVDPSAARGGAATAIMDRIETDIAAAGYQSASLHATLGAIPFYRKRGWRGGLPVVLGLPGGLSMVGLSMTKQLEGEVRAAA